MADTVETIFTFGQTGSYLFKAASSGNSKLPQKLRTFILQNAGKDRLASCHSLSLGAGDSFFTSIGYDEVTQQPNICYDGLPPGLREFITEKDSTGMYEVDLTKLKIVLGPYNKSWWASDGELWKSCNLPPGLEEKIRHSRGPDDGIPPSRLPKFISLGADGSYFVRTFEGGSSWYLPSYQKLAKLLKESRKPLYGLAYFKNLVLHPYRYDCWMVQSADGKLLSNNLPVHMGVPFDRIQAGLKSAVEKAIKKQKQEREEAERHERQRIARERQRQEAIERQRLARMKQEEEARERQRLALEKQQQEEEEQEAWARQQEEAKRLRAAARIREHFHTLAEQARARARAEAQLQALAQQQEEQQAAWAREQEEAERLRAAARIEALLQTLSEQARARAQAEAQLQAAAQWQAAQQQAAAAGLLRQRLRSNGFAARLWAEQEMERGRQEALAQVVHDTAFAAYVDRRAAMENMVFFTVEEKVAFMVNLHPLFLIEARLQGLFI